MAQIGYTTDFINDSSVCLSTITRFLPYLTSSLRTTLSSRGECWNLSQHDAQQNRLVSLFLFLKQFENDRLLIFRVGSSTARRSEFQFPIPWLKECKLIGFGQLQIAAYDVRKRLPSVSSSLPILLIHGKLDRKFDLMLRSHELTFNGSLCYRFCILFRASLHNKRPSSRRNR